MAKEAQAEIPKVTKPAEQSVVPARKTVKALSFPSATDSAMIEIQSKSWANKNHAFIVQASSGSYTAEIVTAQEILGKNKATAKEIQKATGATVVVNGGFFEADGSPSGLYLRKGKVIHEFVPGKGDGILYSDASGRVHIIHSRHHKRSEGAMVDAIQLNLLSTVGETFHNKDYKEKKLPRNMIGINEKGLVDVVFKKTNFAFAEDYMIKKFGCHTVAALDGGPSASAYCSSGKSSFSKGDVPEVAVPNFLILRQK